MILLGGRVFLTIFTVKLKVKNESCLSLCSINPQSPHGYNACATVKRLFSCGKASSCLLLILVKFIPNKGDFSRRSRIYKRGIAPFRCRGFFLWLASVFTLHGRRCNVGIPYH